VLFLHGFLLLTELFFRQNLQCDNNPFYGQPVMIRHWLIESQLDIKILQKMKEKIGYRHDDDW
jgi:hypothetical protein